MAISLVGSISPILLISDFPEYRQSVSSCSSTFVRKWGELKVWKPPLGQGGCSVLVTTLQNVGLSRVAQVMVSFGFTPCSPAPGQTAHKYPKLPKNTPKYSVHT